MAGCTAEGRSKQDVGTGGEANRMLVEEKSKQDAGTGGYRGRGKQDVSIVKGQTGC